MLSSFAPIYNHWIWILISLATLFSQQVIPDNDINVQKNEAHFNNHSITFSLNASSLSKISHATLIHGMKSNTCLGDSQAHRQVEFIANNQIEIQWVWDLAYSGNLPPGATIWWQWELQDEYNRTLLTDVQTLTIEDTNFDWKKIETRSLTLFWAKGDRNFGLKLIEIASDSLQRLSKEAGLESTESIRIMIYPSSESMQDALVTTSDWAGGVAFPEYNAVMIGIAPDQIDWAAEAIPHELAHLITDMRIYNCTSADLPTWLGEGLADYAAGPTSQDERAAILAALKAGNLPALTSLSNGFAADSYLAAQSYDQSHMVVEFIIDHYGQESIKELLDRIREGKQIDTALREVYGQDTTGLDQTWRASLGVGTAPQTSYFAATASSSPKAIPTLPLFSPFSSPTTQPNGSTQVAAPSPSFTPTPLQEVDTASSLSPPPTQTTQPATTPKQSNQYLLLISLTISGLVLVLSLAALLRRNR